jgi:hypothetical protein
MRQRAQQRQQCALRRRQRTHTHAHSACWWRVVAWRAPITCARRRGLTSTVAESAHTRNRLALATTSDATCAMRLATLYNVPLATANMRREHATVHAALFLSHAVRSDRHRRDAPKRWHPRRRCNLQFEPCNTSRLGQRCHAAYHSSADLCGAIHAGIRAGLTLGAAALQVYTSKLNLSKRSGSGNPSRLSGTPSKRSGTPSKRSGTPSKRSGSGNLSKRSGNPSKLSGNPFLS